jgi:hypothetical protein
MALLPPEGSTVPGRRGCDIVRVGRRCEMTRSTRAHGMEGSVTDRRDEERLRVERERRGAELREAWRRHHPSESEEDEKGRPKKKPPA